MISPLLNATDIAKTLKISRSKAFGMMSRGEIPVVRFGGSVRVRETDLENFITNKIIDSISQTSFDSLENITENEEQ